MLSFQSGAGEGNRTLVVSLGSLGCWSFPTVFRRFCRVRFGTAPEHWPIRAVFYRDFTARRSSSLSTASRMKSDRFSPSRRARSTRANVPSRNLAGVCSPLILGLPTGAGVRDITFCAKPCILLISPIDGQSDITYVGDINYERKDATVTTLPTAPLFLQIAAKRLPYPGEALASRMYRETIERYDRETGRGGASTVPQCHIVTGGGEVVGYVSYNGKVWAGDPKAWAPGNVPMFVPGVQ